MAHAVAEYEFLKLSDRELLQRLKSISDDLGEDNPQLTLRLGDQHQHPLTVDIQSIAETPLLEKILERDSEILWRVDLTLPDGRWVYLIRGQHFDKCQVTFDRGLDFERAATFLSTTRVHIAPQDPRRALDRTLGEGLAEFYRVREKSLQRLEGISERLIEQNERYRAQLDERTAKTRIHLEAETASYREQVETKLAEREKTLDEREQHLDERLKELDDRSSRHARRGLRQDLKKIIGDRSKKFALTSDTADKRMIVHALFVGLIAASGAIVAFSLRQIYTATVQDWYVTIRMGIGLLTFASAVMFYIRWTDQWFRKHADEEFRLKRLELDIDRASWVVEMALEWRDERGSEIPHELVDRLSRNLFRDPDRPEASVRHPSEDLASTILGASSSLKMQLPGVGEAVIDRRGLKSIGRAVKRAKHPERAGEET